ncbi:MAG: hypothetical protein V3S30_12145, partial [Thermoanaerobaculia bacterium]
MITNRDFGLRFFQRSLVRSPVIQLIPSDKGENTFRIFVLGGSAAMGTPDASFGLSRVLEALLQETYPRLNFEVVNAAMTAVNSHVVNEIARSCARLKPDLFVIYMGNNEVVGPFGPGTIFR